MKFHRLISAFMLLLAVWLPLDNALAGAVVQGCPMMSHAFERGLRTTFMSDASAVEHGAHAAHHCPNMMSSTSGSTSSPVLYHCVNGCEHCSLCLLLGSVALPINAPSIPVTPALPEKIHSLHTASRVAVAVPLFRPPIV